MKKRYFSIPDFFIDSLPDIHNKDNRELLRSIEIKAGASDIFTWLKQFRIAPHSYDFLDNSGNKSPGYIIENLPTLKTNTHFLLAFHIFAFEENTFIASRFCVPINPPINRYIKEMFIEYRIQKLGTHSILWCKIKGWFNMDIASKGFFKIFSIVNRIMTRRQLLNIRKLSEKYSSGKIKSGVYYLENYYSESGLLWWAFCRRHNCKGLLT